MCERDQLLDRQKLLSRILLQRQWLILWMYALERADPFEACQSRFTSDASHSEAIMRTAHLWPIHGLSRPTVQPCGHRKKPPHSGAGMLFQVHRRALAA